MDNDVVTQHTHLAAALDLAILAVAAADRADLRDLVGLANLGVADHALAELRREHTLHGRLDLVDTVVNDAVHAHVDVASRGAVACGTVGTNVEADDDRTGGGGEHDVAFVDGADGAVDDLDADFLVRDLFERGLDRLGRALNVGLDDQVERLHLAGLDLAEQILQADLLRRAGTAVLLDTALLGELARHALVRNGVKDVAGAGHFVQAGDLNRRGRACLGDALSLVVDHRTHAAHAGAGDNNVAEMQRTVLHQNRHDRAAALVKTRLDDRALGGAVGIGAKLKHFRLQDKVFEQVVDPGAGLGGDRADDRVAAPLLTDDVILGQLLLDAVGVGADLIHLVDRNDDRDARRLCVVDALNGLRHNAVVRRDHKDRDVSHHCTAGAHRGKGLVARGIEEGNRAAVDFDGVSADVLRNAARLAGGDVGVADIVKQRGLAMVDVSHDDNDRSTGDEFFCSRAPSRPEPRCHSRSRRKQRRTRPA